MVNGKYSTVNSYRRMMSFFLLLTAYFLPLTSCVLLISTLTSCGRRGDPVVIPTYEKKSTIDDIQKTTNNQRDTEAARVPEEEKLIIAQPDAPSGLTGIFTGSSIILTWNEVLDQGVTGYRVYRSEGRGVTFYADTATPAFTDKNIQRDKRYLYSVSSIGRSESSLSQSITITTVENGNERKDLQGI